MCYDNNNVSSLFLAFAGNSEGKEFSMYRFVEKPNLPEGKVKMVLAGEIYLDTLRLDRMGIEAVGINSSPCLDAPVASHADMQVVHLYRDIFVEASVEFCKGKAPYKQKIDNTWCKAGKLVELGISVWRGESVLSPDYPACAAYNVLLFGKLAVFNPKCLDNALKKAIISLEYQPVFVKQGFSRCSVCVISQNAVITSDTGIAKALRDCGVDVLLIRPGYIELPGYDTGFIGGASFKISNDTVAFTGRLNAHPDYDQILAFLKKHQMRSCILSSKPVFDIGSAIPIIEEV